MATPAALGSALVEQFARASVVTLLVCSALAVQGWLVLGWVIWPDDSFGAKYQAVGLVLYRHGVLSCDAGSQATRSLTLIRLYWHQAPLKLLSHHHRAPQPARF